MSCVAALVFVFLTGLICSLYVQLVCPHSCFDSNMLVTGAAPAGFVALSLGKFGQLIAVGRSGTVWWYHEREFRPLRWKTQRPIEIVDATLGVPVR